jgi:putative MATE family efflux protein
VGGLGAASIAAVGLGQLLAFIATTLVSGLSVGANVIIAQFWGAKRQHEAGAAASHCLVLGLGVSLGLAAVGITLNGPAMEILGAEHTVRALAVPYATLIFLFIPLTLFLQILSSILQGTGDTRTPMYAMVLVNVLHIIVAYPLIYGRWGAPQLGLQGAALAVGAAEAIGVAYLVRRCWSVLRPLHKIDGELLATLWRLGAPVSGERITQQAGVLFYTKIVLLYGTISYAAHQVGLSIESFSFLPGYGLAVAAATMVGQSIGAGKYARAKLENWEANRIAAAIMATMGIVFFFFPYGLLRAFTHDAAVIALGTLFLKIVALLQIPLALTMVLAGSLRGAGDTRFIMVATLVGMWVVRVPIACVAGLWFQAELMYVWCAMIVDWTIRMTLLLWRYRTEQWRMIQVIR